MGTLKLLDCIDEVLERLVDDRTVEATLQAIIDERGVMGFVELLKNTGTWAFLLSRVDRDEGKTDSGCNGFAVVMVEQERPADFDSLSYGQGEDI